MPKACFKYYKNGTNEIEIDIVGKRRKSNNITGFRLSASRRIRLSDFLGSDGVVSPWLIGIIGTINVSVYTKGNYR
jgi:hypothetical protein